MFKMKFTAEKVLLRNTAYLKRSFNVTLNISEEEKEAAMLFEEADMPLEKLLERYTSAGSGRQLNKLRQNAKLQSPAIRAKKESSSDESDARTNNGDVKLKLEKELLVNGKKEKDSELTSADSGIVVDNQGSSTDMSEAKSVQKSDAVTAKGDDTAVDCNSTSNNGCSQSGQSSGDVPAGLSSSPSAVSSTTSADGPAGGSSSKTPVSIRDSSRNFRMVEVNL